MRRAAPATGARRSCPKRHDPVHAHRTSNCFNPTAAALPRCTARQPPLTTALSPAPDHAFIPVVTPSGDQVQRRLPGSGCCRTAAAAAAAYGCGNKYTPSRLPCPLFSPNGRLHLNLGQPAGHPHSRRSTPACPRAVAPPWHCGPPSRWVGAHSLIRARLRIALLPGPLPLPPRRCACGSAAPGGMRPSRASLSSSLHGVYLQARRYVAPPGGAQRQPLVHPNAAGGACLTRDGHLPIHIQTYAGTAGLCMLTAALLSMTPAPLCHAGGRRHRRSRPSRAPPIGKLSGVLWGLGCSMRIP